MRTGGSTVPRDKSSGGEIVTLGQADRPKEIEAEVLENRLQLAQVRGGKVRFVLPVEIGQARIVDDVSDAEIVAAIEHSRG